MGDQSARQVWDAVLGELQVQVSRPTYETWLRGTVGLSVEVSRFTVGVPTPFAAECLEKRMYSLIQRTVERVVERPLEVRFQVLAEDASRPGVLSGQPETSNGSHRVGPLRRLATAGLNSRYSFETFIVGKSNELAHAAAYGVAERPGQTFNPLFLYSDVGLGKTHLLHAIAHRVAQQELSCLYVSSEQFTNDFVRAIQRNQAEEFRERYRRVDVLLIDDIQFMGGKEHSQEAFFHTFNQLHNTNRQIVITSDRPPEALHLVEDRLRSRFEGGLTVDIKPPELETRIAILRAKAEQHPLHVAPEVLEFIAKKVQKNIRDLEGSLNRVAALAQLHGSPINLAIAEQALADRFAETQRRRLSPEAIIGLVAQFYNIEAPVLKGRRRDQKIVRARQVAMYLLREETQRPLVEIGKLMGGKDHTTVIHACTKVSNEINTNAQLRKELLQLQEALYQHTRTSG